MPSSWGGHAGKVGLEAYVRLATLDLIYPALLALCVGTWILWLTGRLQLPRFAAILLLLPTVANAAFDYLEQNMAVWAFLRDWPAPDSVLVDAGGIFTAIKSIAGALSFTVFGVLALVAIVAAERRGVRSSATGRGELQHWHVPTMTFGLPQPIDRLAASEAHGEELDVSFLTWLTARATSLLNDEAISSSGLTSDEFAIYSMLASGATVTPSDLSQWMAAPPSTVTSYLKRFGDRGHVKRERNPNDMRSYRIELTAAGRKAHATAAARFIPAKTAISTALSTDEEAIRESLKVLRSALDRARRETTKKA